MVVYFRTDWCSYCRDFEEELLGDYRVELYFRNELVKVRINPEDGPEERSVADQFDVTGYPSVFIVASTSASPRRLSLHQRDKDDESVLRTPGDLLDGVEEQAGKAVKGLIYQGYEKREARRAEESVALLTEAIELDSENVEAYLQRGLSHLAAGARERAYEDFRSALSFRPANRDVFNAVGRDLGNHRLWDEGVACWTVYLERAQGEDGWGYLWRSKMHFRRGDRARSREDAESACRLGESQACEALARLGS